MAVVSNVKTYPVSVMWEIKPPSPSTSQKSSCFPVLGDVWCLEYVYEPSYQGGRRGYVRDYNEDYTFQTKKTFDRSVQACSEIPPDLQQLSQDFCSLLDKEIIPDATLTCGSKTWRVHRSILTVRSEVLAAMFRSGMSESETGLVRVEDLNPAVLESLLKYVYGGKVPDMSSASVLGLYEAADKYALHNLRKLLSDWMAEHLSLQNCLDFIPVADAHGDDALKEASVAFITKNFAQIEKASWAKFRKEHLPLVVEVLENFAPAMKK